MAFVIPSIFSAIDRLSAPLRTMGANMGAFATKVEGAANRSERLFNRLTPGLSSATKQMLSFASAAAVGTAVIGGMGWSVKKIMDYESELANLRALTGLSGKEFNTFKGKIEEVAKATQKGNVETTQLFTALANNQPELLKDADGLAKVATATTMLAQAAKMELAPAGEAITQILNQYGQSAKDAAKLVDLLAAGSVAGSSEITDTAAAMQQVGTSAASMNIQIGESVALIELASKFKKGADAGVGLRNILVEMAKGAAQDPKALKDWAKYGVSINTITDISLPLAERLIEMSKIAGDTTAMFHTFGKENMALAQGILGNIKDYRGMVKAVDESGIAAKMAAENNSTLAVSLERLKAKWERMVTGSDGATKGLDRVKNAVAYVTQHLDGIISAATKIVTVFAGWWAINKVVQAVTIASNIYSFALGILAVVTGKVTTATVTNTAALAGARAAAGAASVAQWLFNTALWGCPIIWIIAGIAALIAIIVVVVKHVTGWGEQWDSIVKWMKSVWDAYRYGLLLSWLVLEDAFLSMVDSLVKAWYWFENKVGLISDERYAKNITQIGGEKKARLDAIAEAGKAYQTAAKAAMSGPEMKLHWNSASGGNDQAAGFAASAVNPKLSQQQGISNANTQAIQKQLIQLEIKGETDKVKVTKNTGGIPVKIGSTVGQFGLNQMGL